MPRSQRVDDDWDEYDHDGEGFDSSEDDDDDTVPCPYCHRPIHEDSQRCPSCENYISEEDAPSKTKPWWIVAGALLCLFIVLMWIVGGW